MEDLNHLSPAEYEKIYNVLKRDQELRSIEDCRIRQLKQELICLRKRAALKPGLDPLRNCARCLTELGRILNRGALCPLCLKKVCKDCRHYGNENHDWLCIYCFKQMHLKALSGEWMQDFSKLSIRRRAKEPPSGQVKKLMHEIQRKNIFDNDTVEQTTEVTTEVPPQKPPRLFTYEQPHVNGNVAKKPPEFEGDETLVDSCTEKQPVEKMESGSSTASPNVLPRVSPWNGIDPEPTIPVRIDKSRPFGTVQQFEYSESLTYRERQSSDEGHYTIGYRSRSTSSEVIDESENIIPVPLPRKRLNPLKKQQAVPEPNPVDNQQSSVDTTDSGVCSPGIKAEGLVDGIISPSPRVATKLSYSEHDTAASLNRPPSFAQSCLASESSLSETDDEHRTPPKTSGILFRKVTLKKKKSTAAAKIIENKHSATSAGRKNH